MFFPDRIRLVRRGDRVLEIGPGGSPHPRSDVLLERAFGNDEAERQRGGAPALNTSKQVVFYDGGKFPFADGEFDYVICSHVIEHVEHVEDFCKEMFRVAGRGYIEFPTIYYEFLYNFSVHLNLVAYQAGELRYMPKSVSHLDEFRPVQALFYRSLELGYSDLVDDLKLVMFQGFEWDKPFVVRKADAIDELSVEPGILVSMPGYARIARKLLRKGEEFLARIRAWG